MTAEGVPFGRGEAKRPAATGRAPLHGEKSGRSGLKEIHPPGEDSSDPFKAGLKNRTAGQAVGKTLLSGKETVEKKGQEEDFLGQLQCPASTMPREHSPGSRNRSVGKGGFLGR